MIPLPSWYGQKYPSLEDLEGYADDLGAVVLRGEIETAFCYIPSSTTGRLGIGLPLNSGLLEACWLLAHELGHLVQHVGPKGDLMYSKNEAQADRWAACALLPQTRIDTHGNASEDAFVAALWCHYEEFLLEDCPTRRLAGKIARLRMCNILEQTCRQIS